MSSDAIKLHLLPLVLLAIMFVLMSASSRNDSAIIDELAHIPSGYSYLFLKDYRLNPEHPPLIKDLTALPLVSGAFNFPTDVKSWRDDINGQWDQGRIFLYESGNDPDKILRLMRLPEMLLAVLFGFMLWQWVSKHFGRKAGLLTLFFYAFSPTFLAHSRFVTTDLGAAFAFFIGIAAFVRFLAEPSQKNTLLAGIAFGIAELLKFSLILLLPIYAILIAAWVITQTDLNLKERLASLLKLLAKTIVIGVIGILIIWLVYAWHVWNYPPERQYRDAEAILTSFRYRSWAAFDLWLIQNPLLRPLGQYLLGLFMVLQRAAGGNTQYFLGEVSAAGSRLYFPLLYLLKEPLAFHLLSLIALFAALRRIARAQIKSLAAVLGWIRNHFVEFSSFVFIAVYWASSLSSTLNIGVRHVLPTFPFIYMLASREIVSMFRSRRTDAQTWWEWMKEIYRIYIASVPRYVFVGAMILWQTISVIAAYPNYLSYYNILAGGTDQGYLTAVDSNYDWGQDLKRLGDFAAANNIQKISVDYFGGGSPAYYLGEKFEPWNSAKGYPPGGGWLAISATFQMSSYGKLIDNFQRKPEDSYEWLKPFRPAARAGKSIFIYQLPEQQSR